MGIGAAPSTLIDVSGATGPERGPCCMIGHAVGTPDSAVKRMIYVSAGEAEGTRTPDPHTASEERRVSGRLPAAVNWPSGSSWPGTVRFGCGRCRQTLPSGSGGDHLDANCQRMDWLEPLPRSRCV